MHLNYHAGMKRPAGFNCIYLIATTCNADQFDLGFDYMLTELCTYSILTSVHADSGGCHHQYLFDFNGSVSYKCLCHAACMDIYRPG